MALVEKILVYVCEMSIYGLLQKLAPFSVIYFFVHRQNITADLIS